MTAKESGSAMVSLLKTPAGLVILGALLATGGNIAANRMLGMGDSARPTATGAVPELESQITSVKADIKAMREEQKADSRRLEEKLDRWIERTYAMRGPR